LPRRREPQAIALEILERKPELSESFFEIIAELRRTDQIFRNVLVAHVARLLARLGEGLIFASAEPGQRDEIELLVDIERF
jgi:hypothetical protein